MKLSAVRLASLTVLLTVVGIQSLFATSIEIQVLDAAGYGFDDATAVAPVGGNNGTTLGAQRLNVLQRAGELWAAYLHSDVPIRVECQFQDFGGTPDGYTLAAAAAITVSRDFTNAPLPNVWYPVALANSLAGEDLSAGNDISVTVNIALDTDPDLDPWYYGLDGQAPANSTDLLDVLLHELGHGLGFVSFVDIQSGSFLQLVPDVFSLSLYDVEFGASWGDLSKGNLQLSAVNDPDLTWSGPFTSAASGSILENRVGILVTAPETIAGEYAYEAALFGPPVPEGGLSGTLVLVDDGADPVTDACDPIANGAQLTGNIAYIDRGSCNFDAKVLAVQNAGATAAIIANNLAGGPVFMSGGDEVGGVPLTIPAVSISMEDGAILKVETGVAVTLGVSSSTLAGSNSGYVRMYAPDPVELGSSVSHWSPDASPDLLMEPYINPVLREDLDLSLTLMRDIGWVVIDIPFPYLTYALWAEESFNPAHTLIAEGDDPDGDGISNIEEYFFGGDPEVPSAGILPRMERPGPGVELVYTRATFPSDLAWAYEVSSEAASWSEAVEGVDYYEEIVSPLGDEAEQVRLILSGPSTGEPVFVRLRILTE